MPSISDTFKKAVTSLGGFFFGALWAKAIALRLRDAMTPKVVIFAIFNMMIPDPDILFI